MKILITGATGFIGSSLVKRLIQSGYRITALVRDIEKAEKRYSHQNLQYILWPSIHSELKLNENHYNAVINFMGENIASKRWSDERKIELYNSRIEGTHNLITHLKFNEIRVDTFIQGSATGFYGDRLDERINEESCSGRDFLARLCIAWEDEALVNEDLFKKLCILRTGMVLGKGGGALTKILPPFKLGLGGNLGTGKQYMPWIHLDDFVSIVEECIHNPNLVGRINAVAPELVNNKQFTKTLAKLLRRPAIFHMPKFLLRALLGDLSDLLLTGAKVEPKVLKLLDFKYKYPSLVDALKEVVSK